MTARRVKVLAPAAPDEEDVEDQDGGEDVEAEDDGLVVAGQLVTSFVRMWPRSIFSTSVVEGGRRTIANTIPELGKPGVYILYRDDIPFYVGQAKGKLRSRLRGHANNVGPLKSYFWNYFSAFVVENPSHIAEVEAILISAMPSVITNSSTPKFRRAAMKEPARQLIRQLRGKGLY